MNYKQLLLLALCISGLLSACRKDAGKPQWDIQALTPLAKSTLDMHNLLGDSMLSTQADSSLCIAMHRDIYDFTLENLIQVPDTTTLQSFGLPIPVTLNPGQSIPIDSVSETTYSMAGASLNKIIIRSGKINFRIVSQVSEKTVFTYRIPKASKNGVAFSFTAEVPAAGEFNGTYDLAGYTFDLRGKSGNKVNTIYTSLKANVSPNGQAMVYQPGQTITVSSGFVDMIPEYARGYFGTSHFDVPNDYALVDLFDKIQAGRLSLESVKMKLSLENNIGVDASLNLNYLHAINSRTGDSVSLTHELFNRNQHLNRAVENPFAPTLYSVTMDNSNSNAKSFIENLPDRISYAMSVDINPPPLLNVSNSNDFVFYDKGLKASIDLEIPLALKAEELTFLDTTNFDLHDQGAYHHITGGNLVVLVTNSFPLDAQMTLIELDELDNPMDSLFSNNTIAASPTQLPGNADDVVSKLYFPVSEASIANLLKTKKMVFRIRLNTAPSGQLVKLYSDDKMAIQIVGDFTYRIN